MGGEGVEGGGVEVDERSVMNRENNEERMGAPDRQAGESSPGTCRGASQRIRAVYPLCLSLLQGDNTQYESFMKGGFY